MNIWSFLTLKVYIYESGIQFTKDNACIFTIIVNPDEKIWKLIPIFNKIIYSRSKFYKWKGGNLQGEKHQGQYQSVKRLKHWSASQIANDGTTIRHWYAVGMCSLTSLICIKVKSEVLLAINFRHSKELQQNLTHFPQEGTFFQNDINQETHFLYKKNQFLKYCSSYKKSRWGPNGALTTFSISSVTLIGEHHNQNPSKLLFHVLDLHPAWKSFVPLYCFSLDSTIN